MLCISVHKVTFDYLTLKAHISKTRNDRNKQISDYYLKTDKEWSVGAESSHQYTTESQNREESDLEEYVSSAKPVVKQNGHLKSVRLAIPHDSARTEIGC